MEVNIIERTLSYLPQFSTEVFVKEEQHLRASNWFRFFGFLGFREFNVCFFKVTVKYNLNLSWLSFNMVEINKNTDCSRSSIICVYFHNK